jgi:hypothetical protein
MWTEPMSMLEMLRMAEKSSPLQMGSAHDPRHRSATHNDWHWPCFPSYHVPSQLQRHGLRHAEQDLNAAVAVVTCDTQK